MPRNDENIDSARRANLPRVGGIELDPKSATHSTCPVSHEGRLAIVTDARRDAVDADGAQRRSALKADGEVVWS
jgi:hypothetical protein